MQRGRWMYLFLIAAVVIVGCAKKKVEQQAAAAVADSSKDTADVFNEFLQEDNKSVEKRAPSSYTPEFAEDGRYVVQVSCVGSQKLAEELVATLQGKGWPAYSAEVQSPTPELPGTYYRVRIGGFRGVSAARAFGENVLTPAGYDFWVDNKSNDNVGISSYGLGSGAPSSADYGTTSSFGTAATSSTGSSTWGASTGGSATATTDWGSSSAATSGTGSTSTGTSEAGSGSTGGTAQSAGTTGGSSTGTTSGGTTGGTSGGTGGGWGSDDWGSDW